jgi:hypothetical protein
MQIILGRDVHRANVLTSDGQTVEDKSINEGEDVI